MIQQVTTEYRGNASTAVLTNGHLHLFWGKTPGSFTYAVDLMQGEHKFLVHYHDLNTPLIAAYILDNGEKIEVETGFIDWLEQQGLVYSIESQNTKDAEQSPHKPHDYLLKVNMNDTKEQAQPRGQAKQDDLDVLACSLC